jgi:prepilin-type processing-associated H-X9-DG protein
MNTFSNGAALASIDSPVQVILVGEHKDRDDPEYWEQYGDMLMQNHLAMANFLFCDGHVKSMKPVATGTPINMWNIKNTTNDGDASPGPAPSGLATVLSDVQKNEVK